MMKVSTAQEWVDAAIACGADPHIVPGSFDRHGREIKPGSRGLATKTVDVDWEKPGRCPNEMDEEVFTILASMGRDHRQPKC